MQERYHFYTPEPLSGRLPDDEARHAVRVLRLGEGDELLLLDGNGHLHQAVITAATNHHCLYRITATTPMEPEWHGSIHIAVAPTKNLDRMEWLTEKATEIGVDRITPLDCDRSERRQLKTERLERIAIAAMKQSHKGWLPRIDAMTPFDTLVSQDTLPAQRFIAHCYTMADIDGNTGTPNTPTIPTPPPSAKPFLHDVLQRRQPALVLIGPEGDFSISEVRRAHAAGFTSISLGTSRLRTETAALAAVHMMRIANRGES